MDYSADRTGADIGLFDGSGPIDPILGQSVTMGNGKNPDHPILDDIGKGFVAEGGHPAGGRDAVMSCSEAKDGETVRKPLSCARAEPFASLR